jgi:hypothetical protein
MYRADQKSFMLYPERELPSFLEKNKVPRDKALSVGLLKELDTAGDTSVMAADADGIYRFNGDLSNAADLGAALDRLAEDGRFAPLVRKDRQAVLDLFEEVFDHRSFTGRSGTMYGYEGLGCIYWHMVSKLLLAAEESALDAARGGPENEAFEKLAGLYRRVRSGLSFEKSPGEYGAFPMDPYSHTPPHAGARQPGMTGQVKEEIIARFGELGVVIERGILSFRPLLLERKEFLEEKGEFRYYGAGGRPESIGLPAGSLAFTFCRVPVVYFISDDGPWLRVAMSDGTTAEIAGDSLDRDLSRLVFDRAGAVLRIDAGIDPGTLR